MSNKENLTLNPLLAVEVSKIQSELSNQMKKILEDLKTAYITQKNLSYEQQMAVDNFFYYCYSHFDTISRFNSAFYQSVSSIIHLNTLPEKSDKS